MYRDLDLSSDRTPPNPRELVEKVKELEKTEAMVYDQIFELQKSSQKIPPVPQQCPEALKKDKEYLEESMYQQTYFLLRRAELFRVEILNYIPDAEAERIFAIFKKSGDILNDLRKRFGATSLINENDYTGYFPDRNQ